MGLEKQLVRNAESTVRTSEEAGHKTFYLSYNRGSDFHGDVRHTEPHIIPIRLPAKATSIRLHGPGEFEKRGKGKTYGVRITFTEQTGKERTSEHHRTIELPHPVTQVQLLNRRPDESYKAVA